MRTPSHVFHKVSEGCFGDHGLYCVPLTSLRPGMFRATSQEPREALRNRVRATNLPECSRVALSVT